MIRATLMKLCCNGLLMAFSGCSDDAPEIRPSPSTNEPVAVSMPVETTAGASSMPPSSSAPASEPAASEEPTESQEPALAGKIPTALQGKWLFIGDDQTVVPCTEAESRRIAEIDATSIQLFKSLSTLVSVEESGETIFLGTFMWGEGEDDEDTSQIRLVLLDGERMQYNDLEQDEANSALYGRCPD